MLIYRKDRINKNLFSRVLKYTKSKNLFFKINSNLEKLDDRVDWVLNGRAQFGWTIVGSHTTIQNGKYENIEYIEYKLCDKVHRCKDKPAIIHSNGDKIWYKNGKKHRNGDKPARIWKNGNKYWHKDGLLHRDEDKPAIIWSNGSKFWYKNGEYHRDGDKPAIIFSDGRKRWCKNGNLYK